MSLDEKKSFLVFGSPLCITKWITRLTHHFNFKEMGINQKNSFYLLETFHDLPGANAEEWLGRITSDYRRPRAAYTPRQARAPYIQFDRDPGYSNVTRVVNVISIKQVQLSLLDMLGISHDDFKSKQHTFQSRKVERLRIHHDATVLEAMLRDKEVASDIKEWDLGVFSPLYFIVGLLITDDITYESSENVGHSSKAEHDPVKANSLPFGVTNPVPTSVKIHGEDSPEQPLEAKTQSSGKRIFAIEYRAFRRHLRQHPGKIGKLGGFGPQGDRSFVSVNESDDDMHVHIGFDAEPFSELLEVNDEEERSLELDDVSTEAADSAS